MHLHRALRPGAVVALVLAGFLAGACGGGNDTEEACRAFQELQGSLRTASVDASVTKLAAVEADLTELGKAAGGEDTLRATATKAGAAWAKYRTATQAVPRNEFGAREAYNQALAPLAPFSEACGAGG